MLKPLFFLLLCFSATAFACEVTDDLGRVVTLEDPAKRIISLAPDITENLFAIGAGDRIVGVMQGSDYPVAAKKIPIVARYHAVDMEAILRLRPDLIVAWADGPNVQQWEKWGIPVYISRPKKLTDIPVTLRKLGCLVDQKKTASIAATQYEQHYRNLAQQYKNNEEVTVFYQIWQNPLMTITKQSWIHEAIEFCGGKNIFADLQGVAPEVTIESILVKNPDMIVSADKNDHWQQTWQSWPTLHAVKRQLLMTIDPDTIARASPRLLEGVSQLCAVIDNARKDK